MKYFGKAIKILIVVFLLVVMGAMCVRIYQTSDQNPLSGLSSAIEQAAESGGYTIMTYRQQDPLSDDGVLYAYAVYYIKETGDLQITVRYSTRLLDRIRNLHPEFSDEDVHFTVSSRTGEETIAEYEGELLNEQNKYIYRYRQYLFHGVSFEEIETLLANMYFENIDSVSVPSSLGIWFNDGLEEKYSAK